ncbi:hypothetical protein [Haloarchaeobius sp. DFWS5]|uniref:hypothetical protein n=1 Tax=Haloarchaeobius sp. DFWS5 TaxID=3446114 RepID=UPI003EBC1312
MSGQDLSRLFEEHRLNARLAWLLVVVVAVTAVEELLAGQFLWAAFAVVVAAVALVPPVAYRSPRVMLPWEVLLIAALPIVGRVLAGVFLGGFTTQLATIPEFGQVLVTTVVVQNVATYLSVGALALILAVELHVFTPVRMTVGFAILTVVIMTLAAAGVWAILRWVSHLYFGTAFYAEDQLDLLMMEFVYSTIAGVLAGVTFELYFRRREQVARRARSAAEEAAAEADAAVGVRDRGDEVTDE